MHNCHLGLVKQMSISQIHVCYPELFGAQSAVIKGLFMERLINYKFTYVLWIPERKTWHLPVSNVNSVSRIIFRISWGLVFSTMGTLIQFRKSEFIAYILAAVSVTVLCVVAGRTQAALSQRKITQGFGNEVTITGTADSIRDKALDNSDLPLACFSYTVFQLGWIQWEISLTYCKWYQMICSPAKEHSTVLAPNKPSLDAWDLDYYEFILE